MHKQACVGRMCGCVFDGYGYDVMCRGGCVVGDVCGRAGGSCITGCVACVVCVAWCLRDWMFWLAYGWTLWADQTVSACRQV